MITINLSNKLVYTLIVILSILIVSLVAYAYNSGGPPSYVGHTADELEISTELQIQGVEKIECIDDNSVHEIIAECSDLGPDYRLLSCSGGPGDAGDDPYGFSIIPDLQENKCTLIIKKARCSSDEEYEKQRVYALCYLP